MKILRGPFEVRRWEIQRCIWENDTVLSCFLNESCGLLFSKKIIFHLKNIPNDVTAESVF